MTTPEQKNCACVDWRASRCLALRNRNDDIGDDECQCVCHEEIQRRMEEEQEDEP